MRDVAMKVMLLAAGRGERMGALTEQMPKPLIPVAGKPLLAHQMERLRDAGFEELVVNTAYLGEQIRTFLGDGSQWGVTVCCTEEPQRLETAGGIINALPLLGDDPFLVVNSDVWCDFPLETLQRPLSGLAHLVLVDNPAHNSEGDFTLNVASGRVSDQPQLAASSDDKVLTFSGISLLSPQLFAGVTPGRKPLAPLLRQAMVKGLVSGEYFGGTWIDVGTPDRLAQVATLISGTAENSQHRSESCK